jgi:magnesium transporter
MTTSQIQAIDPQQSLTQSFLLNFPMEAARKLERMQTLEVVAILKEQKLHVMARVLELMSPGLVLAVIKDLPAARAAQALEAMELSLAVNLLSRLQDSTRSALFSHMQKVTTEEFVTLLSYPENTVGRLMNPEVIAFNQLTSAGEALAQLRRQQVGSISHMFLLDDKMQLKARVDIKRLLLVDQELPLADLGEPVRAWIKALDPREDLQEKLGQNDVDVLPVVDGDMHLVGVVESRELLHSVKEDLVVDMQTMVGAHRDEHALSSVAFVVSKRLPWLQVNLLTASMAASVVGLFEATIAQYTALAVLMPIAAGQSGNTGAQALAVTMRGLALREISLRHWYRVMLKECAAGFINGICVALTCAIGVFLWSGSKGLALVLAMAMLLSMTVAATVGSLVPITLKRFGLDPAQASSIVLTTVTDITGFMSFLGIATLLAGSL